MLSGPPPPHHFFFQIYLFLHVIRDGNVSEACLPLETYGGITKESTNYVASPFAWNWTIERGWNKMTWLWNLHTKTAKCMHALLLLVLIRAVEFRSTCNIFAIPRYRAYQSEQLWFTTEQLTRAGHGERVGWGGGWGYRAWGESWVGRDQG